MTELEKMLPELNANQHKWLQGYIAEQRIEELVLHSGGKCEDNPNYWRGIGLTPEEVTDRIATLKQEAGL